MTSIDIFYQGEGIREIAHFEAAADQSFAAVKIAIIEKHGLNKETLIYLEDRDEPVDETCLLRDHAGHAGIKAHLHRCRHLQQTRVPPVDAARKTSRTQREPGRSADQPSPNDENPLHHPHILTLRNRPANNLGQ